MEEKKFCFCQLAFTFPGTFIHSMSATADSFAFLGFQHGLNIRSSLEILQAFGTILRLLKGPASWTEQLLFFLV